MYETGTGWDYPRFETVCLSDGVHCHHVWYGGTQVPKINYFHQLVSCELLNLFESSYTIFDFFFVPLPVS